MAEQTCGVCGQGGYWVGYDSDAKGDRCINHDGTENRETAAYVEGIRVAHGVALARAQQVREGN